jgi:hypothetical protein
VYGGAYGVLRSSFVVRIARSGGLKASPYRSDTPW